jgi:hypothetical protein
MYVARHIHVVPHGMGQVYLVVNPDSELGYDRYDSSKRARLFHPDLPFCQTSPTVFLDIVNWSILDQLAKSCPNYTSNVTPRGAVLCSGVIVPSSGLCRTCHNKQPGTPLV